MYTGIPWPAIGNAVARMPRARPTSLSHDNMGKVHGSLARAGKVREVLHRVCRRCRGARVAVVARSADARRACARAVMMI